MGPGPRDRQPRDPGIWDPLKFKSGTPGPPSKFKSGTPGPPHVSIMNSFFSEYFIAFFTYFFFVSFLNKIQKKLTVSNRNR